MANKLNAKQKQKLIADWTEGASFRALGRKYHISDMTAKKIVESDPDHVQKYAQKKEEISNDVCKMMEAKLPQVQKFIEMVFSSDGGILDPEKIKNTPLNQLSTSLGIILDKCIVVRNQSNENTENQDKMNSVLDTIFGDNNVDK